MTMRILTILAFLLFSGSAIAQQGVSIASGGVASGAFASGSIAAGALAAGAIVDLGANTDTTAYAGSGNATTNALLRGIYAGITGNVPSVTGPLAAATAEATKSLIVGAQYLSTQPTATNTQQLALLTSARGELLVSPGVSGFAVTIAANSAVNVAQINGVTPLMGAGNTGTGSHRVTVATDQTAFSVNAQPTPVTTGGLSRSYASLANSTNATTVKASAGQVYNVRAFNNSANIAYLKFYNKATSPTCNSDTVVDKILIPGNTSGAGIVTDISMGDAYSTGISYCVTGAFGDTDNTAVAASAYSVTVSYK